MTNILKAEKRTAFLAKKEKYRVFDMARKRLNDAFSWDYDALEGGRLIRRKNELELRKENCRRAKIEFDAACDDYYKAAKRLFRYRLNNLFKSK